MRTNPGTEMLPVHHMFCWVTQAGHCLMPLFCPAKQPLAPSSVGQCEPELTGSPEGVKDSAPSGEGTPLKVWAPLELCSMRTEQ